MHLINHAKREFIAAGWMDKDGNFIDDMQESLCNHVLKLIEVFSKEGHSGSTAPYTIEMFRKLASFEPIAPLTGEDWEWVEIGEFNGNRTFQNKRCSHVFKDTAGAYDIDGVVFYEWLVDKKTGEKYKSYFTSFESRIPVVFPYTPQKVYKEMVRGTEDEQD